MKTKWGNAEINTGGHYQIISRKEGNHGKLLHRLVFEDYHDCVLDENDVFHHIDGDKLNNHPSNLTCMSRKAHTLIHHKGCGRSDETKRNISKVQNTSGLFRVHKQKDDRYKQGFRWVYQYYENGKKKFIKSVDLDKLKAKVVSKCLPWEVVE